MAPAHGTHPTPDVHGAAGLPDLAPVNGTHVRTPGPRTGSGRRPCPAAPWRGLSRSCFPVLFLRGQPGQGLDVTRFLRAMNRPYDVPVHLRASRRRPVRSSVPADALVTGTTDPSSRTRRRVRPRGATGRGHLHEKDRVNDQMKGRPSFGTLPQDPPRSAPRPSRSPNSEVDASAHPAPCLPWEGRFAAVIMV